MALEHWQRLNPQPETLTQIEETEMQVFEAELLKIEYRMETIRNFHVCLCDSIVLKFGNWQRKCEEEFGCTWHELIRREWRKFRIHVQCWNLQAIFLNEPTLPANPRHHYAEKMATLFDAMPVASEWYNYGKAITEPPGAEIKFPPDNPLERELIELYRTIYGKFEYYTYYRLTPDESSETGYIITFEKLCPTQANN